MKTEPNKQTNYNTKLHPMKTVVSSWSKKIFSFGVCTRIYGRNQLDVNKRRKEKLKKLKERERECEQSAGGAEKHRLQLAWEELAGHPHRNPFSVSCNIEQMNSHNKQNQIVKRIPAFIFHVPVMLSYFNHTHNDSSKTWLKIPEVQTQGSGEMRLSVYNSFLQIASKQPDIKWSFLRRWVWRTKKAWAPTWGILLLHCL